VKRLNDAERNYSTNFSNPSADEVLVPMEENYVFFSDGVAWAGMNMYACLFSGS
jgi:hypothetical protein